MSDFNQEAARDTMEEIANAINYARKDCNTAYLFEHAKDDPLPDEFYEEYEKITGPISEVHIPDETVLHLFEQADPVLNGIMHNVVMDCGFDEDVEKLWLLTNDIGI